MRRLLRRLCLTGALGLLAIGCSSASEEVEDQGAAISDPNACPTGLVGVVKSDHDWHLFSPKVADACLPKEPSSTPAPSAKALEGYLAKHPFTSIGKPADFVTSCLAEHEAGGDALNDEQERAIVGNYYYLMNSLKQDALATLESLAGLNTLLGNEPLPEKQGLRYDHPYLHESGDWARRLQAKCQSDPSQRETLVQFTTGIVWQVRKMEAALYEGRMELSAWGMSAYDTEEGRDRLRRIEELEKARDALIASVAPWLDGREMAHLKGWQDSLEGMVAAENHFDLVDEHGYIRLKEFQKQDPKNPMRALEAEVRVAFEKQLRTTVATLEKHLADLQKAADYLHKNEDSPISASDYQDVMNDVRPFDPNVFADYYASEGFTKSFSEETLTALETDVRAAAPNTTNGWEPMTDLSQRLLRIEVAVNDLDAGAHAALKDRTAKLRKSFDDATNGFRSSGELAEAKCRNETRGNFMWRDQLAFELGVAAALTVATLGVGSWLAAARVAYFAGEAAMVGVQWAKAARVSVLAARGAQGLAKSGTSYQTQARILWGVLLGANSYFIGEGVAVTIAACNEMINDNMLEVFEQPFDLGAVQCQEGKNALSKQAIADYRGCATNVVLVGALSLVGLYAGAREMRFTPLARR